MKSLIVGIFFLASFGAQANSCALKAVEAVKANAICSSGEASGFKVAQELFPFTSQSVIFEVAYFCSGEVKGGFVAFDDECNGEGKLFFLNDL